LTCNLTKGLCRSFVEILPNLFLKKFIHVRLLFYFFLPNWTLVISRTIEDIFKIIKSKYASCFIYNEKRQKVHLHINFWSYTYAGSIFCQRYVLYYEKFVLQPYILRRSRHFELILLLVYLVLVNSLTIHKDAAFFFHAIISNSIEISLTISKQRNIYLAMSYFLISTDRLNFVTVVTEGDILLHKVNHADNS
jgi:hypothetical protein